MTRGEFDRLVQKYRIGQCTPDEIALLEQWMEGINTDDSNIDRSVFENEAEAHGFEEAGWRKIQNRTGLNGSKRLFANKKWLLGSIAASFLLMSFGWMAYFSPLASNEYYQSNTEPVLTGLESINSSSTPQRIVLPDSSIVVLAEGASMYTSENYGKQNRTVRLKGHAFFDIRSDPNKPFLVYSGDLVTEVLGTSFSIKPQANHRKIEVSVISGKVSVYSNEKDGNKRKNGVIITPNQKAIYDVDSKLIHQDLVEIPQMVVDDIATSEFDFDDTPLGTVLDVLRRTYGMEIVVSSPEMNNCLFTGNLNGFDLFKQLEYICKIVGSQYEVRGTTIFLAGRGCK